MKNNLQKNAHAETSERLATMTNEYLELCKRQDSLMQEIFESLLDKEN
jgi:hypothetical protein